MKSFRTLTNVLVSMVLLIVIWQAIVLIGGYNDSLLPAPLSVGKAVLKLLLDGTLWTHLQVSLLRFAAGYFSASITAIVLGLLLGRLPVLWGFVDPIVQVIRPVSPIAWSPFIVLWFGIGNAPAIVIIFLAAFFPVLLSTVTAVRKMDVTYLKVAQNLEIGRYHLFSKIILPAIFPFIANGLHIAVGTSWIFLVSGEMVGAQSGLGFMIVDARNQLRLDFVLAGIIFIGLCGLLLDRIIRLLERWMDKQWGIIRES
ncbi:MULTISPECIES: ABC transporter permease [Paenibacillus]|uniref:ABC transporter permease n=1 Tax=Paenibacillus naphthalenovorans TaxID=162209 RepID=A0A0U2UFY9_9BACL|nr:MULTISPECIES: ABC transporter permease [Paenibacillus]ALS25000.1 ABC transporter permease [Paenibacillus naphthalenovorans]GCL74070.1 ABC transporter permease [Paenibacillus naphthalenovorans]SDJ33671.1 NitT/TauT family transport system permease protein [Paenibacillus naphthalenovorans]